MLSGNVFSLDIRRGLITLLVSDSLICKQCCSPLNCRVISDSLFSKNFT